MGPSKSTRGVDRLRAFVKDYTAGVSQADLKRLFDREASEAYAVLTRDRDEAEPADGFKRFLHRVRLLFLGISSKLNPARRMLFAGALLGFALGLLDFDVSIRARDDAWSMQVDFAPFFTFGGFALLLFLFALELVDRVRVRDELEVARQLQNDLLPHGAVELPGYRVAHSYRTANEVGGDYYDLLHLADGRVALVVGDASGHGMAAGLVMAIANATLKTALDLDPSPPAVAALLNRTLCRTGDRRTYMTLFYGLLEPAGGRLEYVSAGHPFPLLRRAGGEVSELGRGGLPLGLRDPLPLASESVLLGPGDLLLLYSDGLPEALSATGAAFGFDRLSGLLAPGGTPPEIHDRVLAAFDRHTAGEPLKDDLTLMVLLREPELPPLPAPPPPEG